MPSGLSAGIASGCGCIEPSVQVILDAPSPSKLGRMGKDTKKIAVFKVSRVWRGKVGPTFEGDHKFAKDAEDFKILGPCEEPQGAREEKPK